MANPFTQSSGRITLDLPRLLADGLLAPNEISRLQSMAEKSKMSGIIANILLIFGAFMAVAGVLALEPSLEIGLMLAIISLAVGGTLVFRLRDEWGLLGQALVLMGTTGLCGWASLQFEDLGGIWPSLTAPFIAGITVSGALIFRNAVLAALSPIAIAGLIGSGTSYWHATYGLYMQEATVAILLFGTLAAGLFGVRDRLPQNQQFNAIIMARVSFILANFGFWIGSLWGDYPGEMWRNFSWENWEAKAAWQETALYIPDAAFSIAWLAFLSVAIVVGLRTHRRFISNTALVFLGIHFYTQLYETLLATPWSLVIAGISLIALGFGVVRFDRWQRERATA